MKLTEVQSAHNIYVAQWCDNGGDCLGFAGPTFAAIGEYEVFGDLSRKFMPDNDVFGWSNHPDPDYGYILVGRNLKDALKGRRLSLIQDYENDKRNEFGKYIGKHPDIKFYP